MAIMSRLPSSGRLTLGGWSSLAWRYGRCPDQRSRQHRSNVEFDSGSWPRLANAPVAAAAIEQPRFAAQCCRP